LTEYRLEELAEISGVSPRNIRAYRERGLLGAPRRQGRSAFYNDAHLAPLRMIDRLLRRGFNSVHIAEFFAAVREGKDLADVLELDRSVLESPRLASQDAAAAILDLDPMGAEAHRLVEYGLARRVQDGRREGIVLTDPVLADVVRHSPVSHLGYVHVLLRVFEAVREGVDRLAAAAGAAPAATVDAGRNGGATVAPGASRVERVLADYRRLVGRVVSRYLDEVSARLPVSRPRP